MHIAYGVDPGLAHRRCDRARRLADLGVPADLLGQEVAGMGDADAQSRLARAVVRDLGTAAAREHGHVRREHPLRAARHDERDSAFNRPRGERQVGRQGIAQSGDSVLPGEIVHPAIALGLPQHREN